MRDFVSGKFDFSKGKLWHFRVDNKSRSPRFCPEAKIQILWDMISLCYRHREMAAIGLNLHLDQSNSSITTSFKKGSYLKFRLWV